MSKGKAKVQPETPPVSEQIAVRVPPEMKAAILAAAKADTRSLSSWVQKALKEALERQKKPN